MIKYLGSKRVLVDAIVGIARCVPSVRRVCDLFTGTTRVAQGLKKAGFFVLANDLATYSEVLATTYVATDRRRVDPGALRAKLAHLEALPGRDGYFTRTFAEDARYFQPHNARRIDAIRPEIDRIADSATERAILLTSLMEAADRVDSTTGVQMAYVKAWSKRSYNDLELRLPRLVAGEGLARREDAVWLAGDLEGYDLAYIDPPYNQHSYFSNYHVWETLIRGDEPETYGVANKRVDCRTEKSDFNSKRRAWDALAALIRGLATPWALLSFSDEGFHNANDILALLRERWGEVAHLPVEHRRYVGAQIGIHNPAGEKVGEVSHLTNREYLFLAGEGATRVLEEAVGAATGVSAAALSPGTPS
ncbi:MAG TPA: DNA adenine methylase [Longimicrobiales bacterium]|nr:DNA adenine methylase [Longimicrobiales bacterium]